MLAASPSDMCAPSRRTSPRAMGARGGSGSGFVAGSYKGKTGIVQKLTPQKAHVALLDVLYVTHDTLDLRWA